MRTRTFVLSSIIGVVVTALSYLALAADPEFLRPEEAFTVEARVEGENLIVNWSIADGYYLYRKRFKIKTETAGVTLGPMVIPAGVVKEDEYFGKSEVYRNSVTLTMKVSAATDAAVMGIAATSQGCADAGLCYPPDTRALSVAIPQALRMSSASGAAAATPPNADKVKLLSSLLGVGPKADAALGQSNPMAGAEAAEPSAIDTLSALGSSLGIGASQPEFLDPDIAFQLDTELRDGKLHAHWSIADAYYLYRNKFAFKVIDDAGDILGAAEFVPGKVKQDEYFGEVEVYYQQALATIPVVARPAGTHLAVAVTYQGCADAGLCYPPITKTVRNVIPAAFTLATAASSKDQAVAVSATAGGASSGSTSGASASSKSNAGSGSAPGATAAPATRLAKGASAAPAMVSEQDRLTSLLAGGSLWLIIAAFFGGGLLLSLTPCVFPMIPILSSIIVGQGAGLSRSRAFLLSFIYVQGMALTYTVVGVVAGKTGANLQVIFQDPYVLSVFAAVFVLLALSMFGFYELQLPSSWQARLSEVSNRQRSGSYTGVAVMGVLSALIVGPCVAPPLFGALAYISTTGDAFLGGVALYALSMGLGVPLLIVGVSAGAFMPRAGGWMEAVKRVFGVLLLAVALFFLERILPGVVAMLLWAILLIVSAIYMGALDQLDHAVSGWRRLWKGLGLVLLIYGVLLMVGASVGNTDPLQPLKGLGLGAPGSAASAGASSKLEYRWIKGVEGLDSALQEAAATGRPVMLDYYADWCISCKEMDKFTFTDAGVIRALDQVLVLKTDVTANDAVDKALMDRFGLFGPPTIQFFGADGIERKGFRVVGFMNAADFKAHVQRALSI